MVTRAYELSYTRKAAKEIGLTFKATKTRLNGGLLYKLVDRKTGKEIVTNYMLSVAFNDAQNGFASLYL